MQATTTAIKVLRAQTGAGIMECKLALEESHGDLDKAMEVLRRKGIAKAATKLGRQATEGVIECYIHSGSRIGAIVELNCETDFVARTPEFRELAHNLAMQVAAMAPEYVDESELPQDSHQAPGDTCLLQQPFIKDSAVLVKDLIVQSISLIGENIQVRRFTRFALGE